MEYFSGICPLRVPTSGASLSPLWPPPPGFPCCSFQGTPAENRLENWVLPQSKAEKQNPLVLVLRAALAVSRYLCSCWGWDGTGAWGRYSCWYRGRETWVVLLLLGAGPVIPLRQSYRKLCHSSAASVALFPPFSENLPWAAVYAIFCSLPGHLALPHRSRTPPPSKVSLDWSFSSFGDSSITHLILSGC